MAPKFVVASQLQKVRPRAGFKKKINLNDYLRIVPSESSAGKTVVEFIGSKDFPNEFRTLQQYEVDAGRDEEPILYRDIYNVVEDSNLPEFIPIYRTGPVGVIFEEIYEGGEVNFITIGQSQSSIQVRGYGAGIEYSKQLLMYNYVWQIGMAERQAGVAVNALLNHAHLGPIITYTYPASNTTAAGSGAGTLENNYLRTLEAAVLAAEGDVDNPRRGPYALLISTANRFTMERALTGVPQQTYEAQGLVMDDIQVVIAYNGWTGTRGKKQVSYAGVTQNEAYLISLQNKALDFQSFTKQPLQNTQGNPDVSRFILEQQIWDIHFAVFANPLRSVEKITLPTSAT